MKALVTGGAGFIGSHLAEALCRRGIRTVILDNLSGGSGENLRWKKPGDHLELIEGDICDERVVRCALEGCSWVFHEAALVSVPLSVAEPERTHRENLTATVRLLELSRLAGVKRFVFASSCSVLGDVDHPARETDPVNPASPYALQKFAAERYVQMYTRHHGLPGVALRYFNVYGPRQSASSPYSGVIARFCSAFLQKTAPVIFGDGKQTRDFVYVGDVVQANLLAAESPDAPGEIFHVGSGQSTSLLDLIATLQSITGEKISPRFEPRRAGDIRFSQGDISRARAILGFKPAHSLGEGLSRTLEFYRSISEGAASK
jgi:UDP-glucose 4-epimerase